MTRLRGRHAPAGSPQASRPARRRARGVAVLGGVALALPVTAVAWAWWMSTGGGAAVATTGSLLAPAGVTAVAPSDSDTVALTWTPARLGTGQQASSYVVQRVRASDQATFPACGSSPASPILTSSCDDTGVIDGVYRYRVTARFESWTALSAPSNDVTVINDTSLPTVLVTSMSPAPNGNGWHATSPVTVDLEATAGRGVASITTVLDGGTPVTTAGDTRSVVVAGDGVHTLDYWATDTLGNEGAHETVEVRIDGVAPVAPSAPALTAASDTGTSSTDRITRLATPTLTGTAEEGTTVTLYDGATPVGSVVAGAGGWSITTSALSHGTHSLAARSTDLAGNTTTGPATSVTVDTVAPTAPVAPTLTAASDSGSSNSDRITNVVRPTFAGTAESGATVTLYNATTAVGTATSTGADYTVTATTALATGSRTMTVRATDVAGNTSASSGSTVVTIDTTAPNRPGTPRLAAASDTGRSASDRITRVTTPTFTGTTTAGTTVNLFASGTQVATTYAGGTTWSLTTSTLASAGYTMTARSVDVAGNVSAATSGVSLTVDTVAPPAPSIPKANTASDSGRSTTDGVTKVVRPALTGTNESRAIVTVFDGAAQIGVVTTTNTAYSVTSSTLAEGSHSLTATSTDVAGNVGVASSTGTLVIDTTAPTTAVSAPTLAATSDTGISNSDRITNDTTATFTGIGETGLQVQLFAGSTATGSPFVVSGGSWSATTSALANATHTVTAVGSDLAGNAGPASTATAITVDTVAPTLTLNQASGQVDPATTSPIRFTATFSEPAYNFVGGDVTVSSSAGTLTTVVSGGPATYDLTLTGMVRTGTVTASVAASRATDAAGNNNTASTSTDNTVTWSDTAAPGVSITGFTKSGTTVTVSGTGGTAAGDSGTVTVVICTSSTYPCAAGSTKVTLNAAVNATTGAWSITSASLGTTAQVYARATQSDQTGNTGTSGIVGPLTLP